MCGSETEKIEMFATKRQDGTRDDAVHNIPHVHVHMYGESHCALFTPHDIDFTSLAFKKWFQKRKKEVGFRCMQIVESTDV